jgi:hypothetical protein
MADRTTLQQRLHIVQCSEDGLSDRLIANKIDRSVQTVRKWRRRGQRLGRGALASKKMGRPKKGGPVLFPPGHPRTPARVAKGPSGMGTQDPACRTAGLLLHLGGLAEPFFDRALLERGGAHSFLREALPSTHLPGSKRHLPSPALGDGRQGKREHRRGGLCGLHQPQRPLKPGAAAQLSVCLGEGPVPSHYERVQDASQAGLLGVELTPESAGRSRERFLRQH